MLKTNIIKTDYKSIYKGSSIEINEHFELTIPKFGIMFKASIHWMDRKADTWFSMCKEMEVIYLPTNRCVGMVTIDERGFNIIYIKEYKHVIDPVAKEAVAYLMSKHAELKKSDSNYGTYDSNNRNNTKEGRKNLGVHHLFNYIEKELQSIECKNTAQWLFDNKISLEEATDNSFSDYYLFLRKK